MVVDSHGASLSVCLSCPHLSARSCMQAGMLAPGEDGGAAALLSAGGGSPGGGGVSMLGNDIYLGAVGLPGGAAARRGHHPVADRLAALIRGGMVE